MATKSGFTKTVTVKTNSVILPQAILDVASLATVNTNYTKVGLQAIITRNDVLFNKIGDDNEQEQKESTYTLAQLTKQAPALVSDLRAYISDNLLNNPERAEIIIKNLGLLVKSSGSIIDKVELFNTFNNNIADYTAELTKAGLPQARLTEFTTFGTQYITAATTQTINKGKTQKLTVEENKEFDTIYLQVRSICKVAQRLFRNQPEKAALYNYTAIARRFAGNKTKKTTTEAKKTE